MIGTVSVTAGAVSNTHTGVENGKDVDVVVSIAHGADPIVVEIEGGVTLVPCASGVGWEPYGPSADFWVEGNLLRSLSERFDENDLREVLRKIAKEAAEAIAFWSYS